LARRASPIKLQSKIAAGGSPCEARRFAAVVRWCSLGIRWWATLCGAALITSATAQEDTLRAKFYRIIDGKVDVRTYNGYRRYHAVCNHCHGPDGMGTSFGPSLTEHLPDIETFRRIVHDGQSSGASVMKGFANDPNVAPYVDDIYAYLQARADGVLGRGRPTRLEE
jgi:mono/diheme cytochrome c family protein